MAETTTTPELPDLPAVPDMPEIPDAPIGSEQDERPLAAPATPDAGGFVWGTGRRKASIARVRVRPAEHPKNDGQAKFLINGKEVDNYFTEPQHQAACLAPLKAAGLDGKLEIQVKAQGGGITGQAEAILLGVARALKGYDRASPSPEQLPQP